MYYFFVAVIFFFLGRYKLPGSRRVFHKNLDSMPGHRAAPPPPPPPQPPVMPGHLRPIYQNYKRGCFNSINSCKSCGLIGLREDLRLFEPCRNCGGEVQRHVAAKWEIKDGLFQWVFSEVKND